MDSPPFKDSDCARTAAVDATESKREITAVPRDLVDHLDSAGAILAGVLFYFEKLRCVRTGWMRSFKGETQENTFDCERPNNHIGPG